MRFFKRKGKKNTWTFQGNVATATRALYMGKKEMPRIELKFEVKGRDPKGEVVDEITIELDAWEASKFGDQIIASIQAAVPGIPRGAGRYAFGE